MPGAEFQEAVTQSRQLKAKPDNNELLDLYSHFKQATQDPPFEKATVPGTFDLKNKAKYKAWKTVHDAGTTPQESEEKYVKLVNSLKDKYGFDPEKKPE